MVVSSFSIIKSENTNSRESTLIATSKGVSFVPLIAELPHGR